MGSVLYFSSEKILSSFVKHKKLYKIFIYNCNQIIIGDYSVLNIILFCKHF